MLDLLGLFIDPASGATLGGALGGPVGAGIGATIGGVGALLGWLFGRGGDDEGPDIGPYKPFVDPTTGQVVPTDPRSGLTQSTIDQLFSIDQPGGLPEAFQQNGEWFTTVNGQTIPYLDPDIGLPWWMVNSFKDAGGVSSGGILNEGFRNWLNSLTDLGPVLGLIGASAPEPTEQPTSEPPATETEIPAEVPEVTTEVPEFDPQQNLPSNFWDWFYNNAGLIAPGIGAALTMPTFSVDVEAEAPTDSNVPIPPPLGPLPLPDVEFPPLPLPPVPPDIVIGGPPIFTGEGTATPPPDETGGSETPPVPPDVTINIPPIPVPQPIPAPIPDVLDPIPIPPITLPPPTTQWQPPKPTLGDVLGLVSALANTGGGPGVQVPPGYPTVGAGPIQTNFPVPSALMGGGPPALGAFLGRR